MTEERRDLERYDRQVRIEGWDQENLTRAKIVVVGVGATGCEVAKNLALMGIGKLVLVDNDVVELSNLSRQMLFLDDNLGEPKAIVAADRLRKMNPLVKVEPIFDDVRNLDESIFEEADVLVSCLDNWPVRRWLNSLAVALNKPLVDVAMEGFYANLQIVIPKKTACLECHGEELMPKEMQLAECTLRRRKPEDLVQDLKQAGIEMSSKIAEKLFEHDIKTIYDLKYAQESVLMRLDEKTLKVVKEIREKLRPKLPALQSVAAMISGLASTEIAKILHGDKLGEPIKGLLVYDGLSGQFTIAELERSPDCFVCGDIVEEGLTITVKPSETILELKKRIAEMFSIPDPEVLYREWRLSDDKRISELGIGEGDTLYITTSRRFMPLQLRVRISEGDGA
ncbi:MAG: ThiF family adenylyltransferase [Nitrososphaerota archaeon]